MGGVHDRAAHWMTERAAGKGSLGKIHIPHQEDGNRQEARDSRIPSLESAARGKSQGGRGGRKL